MKTLKRDKILIFILIFAAIYFSLGIFSGLDVTDTGNHLLKQEHLLKSPSNFTDLTWGSNLVGGVWNNLIDKPSLIWSRAGFVLLLLATVLFSYLSLKHYFQPKNLLLPYIVTIVFAAQGIQLIHYYTFPAFLTVLILYFYTKILKTKKSRLAPYSLIIGLIIGFAALSRFPQILLISLPLLSIVFVKFLPPLSELQVYRHLKFVLFGFGMFAIGTMLFSILTQFMDPYLQGLGNKFLGGFLLGETFYEGKTHTISYQLKNWIRVYRKLFISKYFLIPVPFIATFVFLNGFEFMKKTRWVIYGLTAVSPFLLFLVKVAGSKGLINGHLSFAFREGMLTRFMIPRFVFLSFLIFFVFLSRKSSKDSSAVAFLFFLSVIFMVFAPLGSNTFANKFKYGYWVAALPISFATCMRMSNIDASDFYSRFVRTYSRLTIIALPSLIIIGVIFQFNGAYRDYPDRLQLTTESKHTSLNLIHTSEERMKAVDQALTVIEENSQVNDRILCVGKIPLFYYLTERKPYIYDPWPTYLRENKFRELLNENRKDYGLPRLIVKANYSVSTRTWPKSNVKYLEGKPHLSLLKDFIAKYKYVSLWENKMFKIFELKGVT